LTYGQLETNSEARLDIMQLVVAAVKERRVQLAELALKNLSSEKLHQLDIRLGAPLDSNAFATYRALLESGIPVPGALYPGERPLLFSFNFYCELGGFALMQALFDNGVCELDTLADGISTPLTHFFHVLLEHGRKEHMIRWLLERGARTTFSTPKMMPNFLFYLASVYDSPAIYRKQPLVVAAMRRIYERGVVLRTEVSKALIAAADDRQTTPEMIGLVARSCDPTQRDSCRCSCSSGGCLPLHKFRNGISVEPLVGERPYWTEFIPKRWADVSESVLSWIQSCHLDDDQAREYLRDACKLEVFTRLGMAHTCCEFDGNGPRSFEFPRRRTRDPGTQEELREEDEELSGQLDAIMEAYDKALATRGGTIGEFWEWWWTTLEPLLPELPAEQRRRTFGNHQTRTRSVVHISRARPPFQLWEYSYIYDEKDLELTSGARSDTGLDFIDEIRQYFADISPGAALVATVHV
jgi:hypothetical protein